MSDEPRWTVRPHLGRVALLMVCGVMLLATRAGSGPPDPFPIPPNAEVFPVGGSVRWKGQPAEHAKVYLYPVADPSPARWPNGFPRATVKSDGSFAVSTFSRDDGAPRGKYVVLVSWANRWDGSRNWGDDERRNRDRFGGKYLKVNPPRWPIEIGGPSQTPIRIELD